MVRVSHPRYAADVRRIQAQPQQTIEIRTALRAGSSSPMKRAQRSRCGPKGARFLMCDQPEPPVTRRLSAGHAARLSRPLIHLSQSHIGRNPTTPKDASMTRHHGGMPRIGPNAIAQSGTSAHTIIPN